MKSTLKILVVFAILGGIVILGLEFLCRIEIKCKSCSKTSLNKEDSISDGFYLGEYRALSKKVKLKNHNLEIEFSDAWFEEEWFMNSDFCLIKYKEKRKEGFNIIFPFQTSDRDVFVFSMRPFINGIECSTCGGIGKNSKQINISELPDTIEVHIKEKNPILGIGWSQGGLPGEKILYVKK